MCHSCQLAGNLLLFDPRFLSESTTAVAHSCTLVSAIDRSTRPSDMVEILITH